MNGDDYRRSHFVESIATMMEQEGLPRMTGRVMGYLLICEPTHKSSAELADALNASRGAISTATRALLQTGLIHRRPVPGSRATYFEMQPEAMSQLIQGQAMRLGMMQQVIEQGLDLLTDRPPELRTRLQEFHDVLAFFQDEYPKLIARWDAKQKESR